MIEVQVASLGPVSEGLSAGLVRVPPFFHEDLQLPDQGVLGLSRKGSNHQVLLCAEH